MTDTIDTRVANQRLWFINDVPTFAVLRNTGSDLRYATTGQFERNRDQDIVGVKLLNMQRGTIYTAPVSTGPCDDWAIVRDDNGDVEMLPDFVRELVRTALYNQRMLTDSQSRLDKAQSDWELLNEQLIKEANRRDWCGEYDSLVEKWNSEFQVLELRNRKSDYEVTVEVTATWTLTIPVEGMASDDDARDYVRDNMDISDMMSAAGDSWSSPDSSDYDITDVSEA